MERPTVIDAVPAAVPAGEPVAWANPRRGPAAQVLPGLDLGRADVEAAAARWTRLAPLIARLFPEVEAGRIDSALIPLPEALAVAVREGAGGPVLVKADHDLPVTGCIKARGGVYEVLAHAEEVALSLGLLTEGESSAALAGPHPRAAFAERTVAVGSTGNLGFSVGVIARALGFRVEVHMSHDAKAWKKARLRALGAAVVEHPGDYGSAVAAARAAFTDRADAHFVDDEDSVALFLGYATAAADLRAQLDAAGIRVDADRPLCVYLPCGVGGAPGGVAFGLKLLYGDAVRCIFVEPVAAPCMLVQLAAGPDRPTSVYDLGLDNRTAADGLAVSSASMLVARTVGALVEGVVTVTDAELFAWVRRLWTEAGLRLEPSAAAGFAALGRARAAGLVPQAATHVVWTTGGALLPEEEFRRVLAAG